MSQIDSASPTVPSKRRSSTKPPYAITGGLRLKDLERETIIRALAVTGGVMTHAAMELGINVWALKRRMKEHGIKKEVKPH